MPAYRLAIAHDALVYRGGAERVVSAWLTRWPNVPVYTSCYLPGATYDVFKQADVRVSFMQKMTNDPNVVMRRLFPLMVPGFWSFDLSGYDVVLSSAAYAAKTIRVPENVCHLCYCHSPLRLAWRPGDYLSSRTNQLKRFALLALSAVFRQWDYQVAQKVDFYATNCQNVARRIQKAYHRTAEVIHAPIDFSRYQIQSEPENYYLIVSRLFEYKRVDLAIQAAKQLKKRLIIVGEGPQRPELSHLAEGSNGLISFLGYAPEEELLRLYAGCQALIFPQEEDYGLTPLEAQASGRPVVAYGAGGALETIIDGETGVFFHEQTVESLIDGVQRAESMRFEPNMARQNAARFDIDPFCDKMESFMQTKLREFRNQHNVT